MPPAHSFIELSSVRVAEERNRLRLTCKSCHRRRKVDRKNGLCARCDPTQARSDGSSGKASPSSSHDSNELSSTLSATLSRLSSPGAEQNQMLATFLDAHLTHGVYRNYLFALPSMQLSPILSDAVNTLCLAYLGSANHDAHLTHLSQAAYSRVLSQLTRIVANAHKSVEYSHREVITSILIIRLYDDGSSSHTLSRKSISQETHLIHLFGAMAFLEASGPQALDLHDFLDVRLAQQMRMQGLMACIALRKSCFWNKPEWSDYEEHFGGASTTSQRRNWRQRWFPLLVALPDMLVACDKLLRRPRDPNRQHQLAALCADLRDFRVNLLTGLTVDLPVLSVDVNDETSFDASIEEHCFMRTSTVFPHYDSWSNGEAHFRCVTSWLVLLVSDCALLRILHADPTVRTHCTIAEAGQSAFEHASNLCRSMYYYSRRSSSNAFIMWACVYLEVSQAFFEEYGAEEEAEWCRGCLAATQLRYARVKTHNQPTLCRVGDLTHPLQAGIRFLPDGMSLDRQLMHMTLQPSSLREPRGRIQDVT